MQNTEVSLDTINRLTNKSRIATQCFVTGLVCLSHYGPYNGAVVRKKVLFMPKHQKSKTPKSYLGKKHGLFIARFPTTSTMPQKLRQLVTTSPLLSKPGGSIIPHRGRGSAHRNFFLCAFILNRVSQMLTIIRPVFAKTMQSRI